MSYDELKEIEEDARWLCRVELADNDAMAVSDGFISLVRKGYFTVETIEKGKDKLVPTEKFNKFLAFAAAIKELSIKLLPKYRRDANKLDASEFLLALYEETDGISENFLRDPRLGKGYLKYLSRIKKGNYKSIL
jgi:hypothetical protein